MSLTKSDLRAIKKLFDDSFDERVPKIIDERVPVMIETKVQPLLDKLEKRLAGKIDQLTLDVGQFSLETTNNFRDLEYRLGTKIDDLEDKLVAAVEMSDTNRVEIARIKRKTGLD